MTEKRRPLTRAQLAELVLEQMGKCRNCGERLDFAKKGQVVDEHIVPLFSGGTNETSNRALFCKPCATEKTSAETPDRAKVRRIEGKKTQADRRIRAKAEGRYKPISGRGFDQRWRKKLNGTVERKDHD
jgi:5-methylcytosine-specific restriction endonuclease McrA